MFIFSFGDPLWTLLTDFTLTEFRTDLLSIHQRCGLLCVAAQNKSGKHYATERYLARQLLMSHVRKLKIIICFYPLNQRNTNKCHEHFTAAEPQLVL